MFCYYFMPCHSHLLVFPATVTSTASPAHSILYWSTPTCSPPVCLSAIYLSSFDTDWVFDLVHICFRFCFHSYPFFFFCLLRFYILVHTLYVHLSHGWCSLAPFLKSMTAQSGNCGPSQLISLSAVTLWLRQMFPIANSSPWWWRTCKISPSKEIGSGIGLSSWLHHLSTLCLILVCAVQECFFSDPRGCWSVLSQCFFVSTDWTIQGQGGLYHLLALWPRQTMWTCWCALPLGVME